MRRSSSEETRRQIEFVLQQLEAPLSAAAEEAGSDDEEDEEDTDDPTEPIEGDLEDLLRPASAELHGEELLCLRYLFAPTAGHRQEPARPASKHNHVSLLSELPLSRPITPRSFAHRQNNPIPALPDSTSSGTLPLTSDPPSSSLLKSKQKPSGGATAARNSGHQQTQARSSNPPKSQSDPSIGPDRGARAGLKEETPASQSAASTPETQRRPVHRSSQLSASLSPSSCLSPQSKLDPQPSVRAIKKLEGQLSQEVMHEYKEVFVSRPRINRTPEPDEVSSPEQFRLSKSDATFTTDSLAAGSYPPVSDQMIFEETPSLKEVLSRSHLEISTSPPHRPTQLIRAPKQTEPSVAPKGSKGSSSHPQNARSVVTRARSKAKQTK